MNIPNFIDVKVVETEGENKGCLTDTWRNILVQLFTELQKKTSNEGLFVPQQTAANVAILDNIGSKGALLYNSDTNELLVNINGTFKVVQVL